jgi:hypothetical protein
MRQLKQVPDSLESNINKCKYLHNTTWIVSVVLALCALVKDWKCFTESQSRKSASAVAKSLLQKLTIFILIYILHSLLDYSEICNSLSLPFLRLNFSCAQLSHMYGTVSCLESPICS